MRELRSKTPGWTAMWLLAGVVAPAACSAPEAPVVAGEAIEQRGGAITVPSGFIDELFVSGLGSPTAMQFAPDGRLFVTQQGGALRVVKNGALLPTPFVSLSVHNTGERGLLGVAFDPAFATNNFLYVYYTTLSGGAHNRISRLTANGDVAVGGSEVILMDLELLSSATNHNGGAMHFGPDGKLYVAVGENARGSNAQTLSNRLGKLLRINGDGTIPTDNPFFSSATGANRSIWALGLRNPFTFAVQPGTGTLFINDVGQSTWEEINRGARGANYGWPHGEGPNGNAAGDTAPIFAYGHGGGACAITGGAFYNPSSVQFPSAWVGHYFFADYCAGWIRRFDPASGTASNFASGASNPTDLKVGADGALYYMARGNGTIGRIRSATAAPPRIDIQPTSRTVAVGQPATFSVSASGSPPLAYQWQRNGANISGATATSYTLAAATLADSGAQFRVVVSNGSGSVTSAAATLTVIDDRPPAATITAPAIGTLYTAGQTVSYAGTGADMEDGALPASAFTWQVDFHHDTHTHPFIPSTGGATGGSFVVPTQGETSANVFYRITLTVRDSRGTTSTTFVDVRPQLATLSLRTEPAGLSVTLDGQGVTTPADIPSVVGMTRALGAPSPQTSGSTPHVFASWSDGGAVTHNIDTPAASTTYTARFAVSSGGLRGDYFDNADLTNLKVTRVDPSVAFDWGAGSPDPSIGADSFSVRWTGKVTARFSGAHTFYAYTNDGARLWVGGQLLIDNWVNQSPTEKSGTITLTAGQSYDLRFEVYEGANTSLARLSWSSVNLPKEVVPQAQLTPVPAGGGPTFPIRINFQLSGASVPAGYLPDTGGVFAARNGLTYGWNFSHSDVTRHRNAHADQRLDTLSHFHQGGIWELALPNGTYNVLAHIGDPSYPSTHTLNVEGMGYWNALPLASNQFVSVTRSVSVTDGRLSIDQGPTADKATRINFVEISK